ncbi:equilibrative nucleobase transporter 1-like [Mya arenaria]|uniref:equilibrative nucleobase transporter 1-like n=1 Tax=Mya arenaria TaxID=6604 RepID=UPI0022E6F074|nr:equilibrative nucleobase transporter 1-like [Mya arenaria]XP_052782320.1 equilibrative nucleobase transporter 1-like [Mya arenaria]XP_052782328.1 equilibrative nucleobase transporter 1-like [Mya arenaria]
MLLSDSKRSWVKYALAGWAFIECLLFAGILYGWGSLVFIFKSEGIYADLCGYDDHVHSVDKMNKSNINVYRNNGKLNTSNPSVHFIHSTSSTLTETLNNHNGNTTVTVTKGQSCLAQDSRMSLCFTISSSIFCVSCVVMGAVNYKLGTRLTRLIAFPFFIAGSLCFVFLSKDRPWLMFPGLSLIGIGGLPVFVTNTQVSNLFKSGSSSVVGLIVGGYDMSSAVFLVIKLGFHRGFSHQKGFAVLCGMHVMTLVSTFLFLPKGFIEQREDPTTGCQGDEGGRRLSEGLLKKRAQLPRQRSMTVMEYRVRGRRPSLADTQPLSSYLRQPLFLTHSLWLCILQLRFYFFIGNLNTFLTRVLDNDTQQVSYFTNACFYTMMGGLFTSFLAGIVYDSQKAIFKGGQSKLYRRLMPALLPVSLASLLTVVLSVLVLVPSPAVLYVIFIVMTLLRSFLYSVAAAFIQEIFPSQYFALLYGVTMIAAGLFSLFQYALFSWSESYHNGPKHVEVFLLCVGVLSAIHPLYMLVCAIREERSTRQDDQPQLGSAEGTGNREKVETVFTD